MNNPMIAIASIAALGGVCQWLAWRFKLPSILFLLSAGILIGPVMGIFDPDALMGDLLFPIVSIFVAIILFEGGLTLRFSDIRDHGAVVTRLITIGVLLTWLLLATTAHLLFDMPWSLALVFGSIAVVSGPTVVKPLLMSVRPSDKVGHILHWEGILIDPVGVFLALLVFDFVMLDMPGNGIGHLVFVLMKLILVGASIGVAAGFATAFVLRRYLVPDFLVNVLTLTTVVCAFVLAESIQHESGLLAVTVMGVWLANTKGLHIEEILHFKEDLSILLISTLFILLASRVDISIIPQYGWQILLLLAIAQFVVRPLNAMICTINADLNLRERIFIGWLAPRGIVAAAVSSVFFLRLQESGVPMSELLVPLVFSLIIGTVVFQSLTAKPLADRLGISNPEPNGVLFHGANEIAIALATALRQHGIATMLSDTSWGNVRKARQLEFEAYHGNPTSGHASENLDLQGIGKLIAVSPNRSTNALAGMHFRQEFGSSAVFTLEGASEDAQYERFDTANRNRANPLFAAHLNHATLARRLRTGTIRHITLTRTPTENEESGKSQSVLPDSVDASIGTLTEQTDATAPASGDTQSVDSHPPDSSADADKAKPASANHLPETEKELAANGKHKSDAEKHTTDSDELVADAEQHLPDQSEQPHDAGNEIGKDDLKMFAIDKDGRLYVYGAGEKISLKAGWQLIVLSPEQETYE